MFGSIKVCVSVKIFFFFFFFFVFVFSSVYVISLNMYILYVCLHECACSYTTCVWPEFYMQ